MGILNVTPDSFSDGGRWNSVDAAVRHAQQLAEEGADIIDVGGESTRPGAARVEEEEELRRTIPVIRELASALSVPLSIDTTRSRVARQAVEAGAVIVNDISGLTFDPDIVEVCRDSQVGVCLMHLIGTPQTMQNNPQYDDVVHDVTDWLKRRVDACEQQGIEPDRICVDPGIGFGKTARHNVELLNAAGTMQQELGRPLLVGHSRKRFLAHLLGRPVDERTAGTTGISVALAEQGVSVLRVHDVGTVRDALVAWSAVQHGLPSEDAVQAESANGA